jgi:hypothetical protein
MLKEKLLRYDPENSFNKLHIWQVNFCGFSRLSMIACPQRREFIEKCSESIFRLTTS